MSQNEQTPKQSDDNDAEVNKDDDEIQNENDDDKEEEGNQPDSSSAQSSNNRAPPKRAAAAIKSHPSHSSRGAPSFESQMSPEQIETNLIKLLGNNFLESAKDKIILSDYLSVRDLRIIVRVLKLCGPSQVNVRKPLLCDFLMKHMQTEHMAESYKKYTEEKERARLARLKSREEKTRHALEVQAQNTVSAAKETPVTTSTTALAATRSQTRRNSNEKSISSNTYRRSSQQNQRIIQSGREKQPIPSISSTNFTNISQSTQAGINSNTAIPPNANSNFVNRARPAFFPYAAASIVVNLGGANSNVNSLSSSNSGGSFDQSFADQSSKEQMTTFSKTRDVKEVTIPRLKYDSTFDMKNALDILKRCNEFVLMVSDRLTEMERAISIMTFKIAELEKII